LKYLCIFVSVTLRKAKEEEERKRKEEEDRKRKEEEDSKRKWRLADVDNQRCVP